MASPLLEICIDSVLSAKTAEIGGADRVELCDNLVEGGTTPSYGMIQTVRSRIAMKLMVMIRPRGGDFLYSDEEFEIMKSDIQIAKDLGADGVVFGLLKVDGSVDTKRCNQLIHLARPMSVTFHRAFDMVKDPIESLDDLIELGVDRVLTSGLQPDAISGQDMIKELITYAEGRIKILAGGGIRLHNVKEFVEQTNVQELHVSGRQVVQSPMTFRNEQVRMGSIPDAEYATKVTNAETVRLMSESLVKIN